ncbi:MAG: hypothetical protein J1F63_05560 [Oscillospiraceae bacterium]|nr:hypothetical protein [Oscillospiraceae bacterium]
MKKFFEAPEISSVELSQADVIMASPLIGQAVNTAEYNVVDSEVSSDYKIWKGFN